LYSDTVFSHFHLNQVASLQWNMNGWWLLSGAKDHKVKLVDIRKMNRELATFGGHRAEVSALDWHPVHERLFSSATMDGAIRYFLVGSYFPLRD
jgi:polyadenylation factor subunit 2